MNKNITLAVDEEVLKKVRIVAAKEGASVNSLVREYLTRLAMQESDDEDVTETLLRLSRESQADMGDWRPSREDTYSGEPRFDRWR